jgi:hypothetical protein
MIFASKSRLLLFGPRKSLGAGAALWLLLTSSPALADLAMNGDFAGATNGNGQLNFNTVVPDWTTPGWPGSYFFVWNADPGTTSGTTADNGGAPGIFNDPATNPVQLWGPGTGSNNQLTLSPDGGAFIGSSPAFHNGPISQTITGLTKGLPTIVSFDYAGAQQFGFTGSSGAGWAVSLGSGAPQDTAILSVGSEGFSGWHTASFTFTPTSSSETLSFLSIGQKTDVESFALLDSVKVDPIPELSTWAMMALGFAGLGYVGFRSNRRKPAWSD